MVATTDPHIEIRDLRVRYGTHEALAGVSLTIPRGVIFGIIGPANSGKTTLLNLVGALDTPTEGRVRLGGVDLTTASYDAYGEGHLLLRDDMAWFVDKYLTDPAQRAHPYVAPLRAETVAGVAPAYLAVGGYDPLLDEGLAYAERLNGAGVEVRLRNYEQFIHGFLTMPKAIPSTQRAIDEVVADLGELIGAAAGERQSA